MATPHPQTGPIGPDTLIAVKVIIDGTNRRFKLALRDLGAHSLPTKLQFLLAIPPDSQVRFERYSDSAGAYVLLDSNNPAIYKQLYRAAKAKLKLRIKATVIKDLAKAEQPTNTMTEPTNAPPETQAMTSPAKPTNEPRHSYLETVLGPPMQIRRADGRLVNFSLSQTKNSASAAPSDLSSAQAGKQASTETLVASEKTEVPQKPTTSESYRTSVSSTLSRATLPSFHDFPSGAFCIDCNNCGKSIPNEHYHCNICDDGDYDLCQDCVDSGYHCGGEGHWLIKRFVNNGMVINSTTETVAPKKISAEKDDEKTRSLQADDLDYSPAGERTCNSCVGEYPDGDFVSCLDCPDYDLCYTCLIKGTHGHHPAHTFRPIDENNVLVTTSVMALCKPGRDTRHAALCDGCDKTIVGVRHKCLTCPDWDYCSTCITNAPHIHPGHRFVPVYESLPLGISSGHVHHGIYCDGLLCEGKAKRYIRGDRYKCAVCHDTDFCGSCEADPMNTHNRTHPLIKFKTPVRHVSVTTLGEEPSGERLPTMGDQPKAKNAATETTPAVNSTNAATQVQTVAEVKPEEEPVVKTEPSSSPVKADSPAPELQAYFMRDTIPDGSKHPQNGLITQTWTLYNPGPLSWPIGCSVRYIGGDSMLNVDNTHPSDVSALTAATESNVMAHPVAPGTYADFTIVLKTPQREGKAISYWRLKTPEGLPFGHKLWCDVEVTGLKAESFQPKVEGDSGDATSTPVKDESKSQESSIMIFPKLEKESPVSSTYDIQREAPALEPTTTTEEQELLEDVESLELEDDDSEEGFLTDEEYDILDASDEEFLAEAQKAAK